MSASREQDSVLLVTCRCFGLASGGTGIDIKVREVRYLPHLYTHSLWVHQISLAGSTLLGRLSGRSAFSSASLDALQLDNQSVVRTPSENDEAPSILNGRHQSLNDNGRRVLAAKRTRWMGHSSPNAAGIL